MPSVLIELGYLTNAKEEAYLNSAKGQEQMADAIYHAFRSYKWALENSGKTEQKSGK
jgi:N-acetylmuramoyl-L-alanine amidase